MAQRIQYAPETGRALPDPLLDDWLRPAISMRGLSRSFGSRVTLENIDLEIEHGEILVVLGPSGSGKTTLLKIIAGLDSPDAGDVFLNGTCSTHLSPQKRGLGVVFQEQALFQRMTAAENVAFGLKVRNVDRESTDRTVNELLELTGLSSHRQKYPSQLSGGQRQRVALARALAHKPQAMLFDEPFSALDAVTRTMLRREVRSILRELKVAALFITHDQEEAMGLADRIAILHDGKLQQVGTPFDIYTQPRTEFVATFLGAANVLRGRFAGGEVEIGTGRLPITETPRQFSEGQSVKVLFRPEDIELLFEPEFPSDPGIIGQATIDELSFAGSTERISLKFEVGVEPCSDVIPELHESRRQPSLSHVSTLVASRSKWESGRRPAEIGETVSVFLRDFRILSEAD
ncbi:MAG: sulfate/thiosulfate transport system ATP-binding protein [Blastocatellia bacterium]|nr:sulfate/thiosulfate transport system ATP-binding protein [Blastocatellia bacterium]